MSPDIYDLDNPNRAYQELEYCLDLDNPAQGKIKFEFFNKKATLNGLLEGRKIKIVLKYKNELSLDTTRKDFNKTLELIQNKGIESITTFAESLNDVKKIKAEFSNEKGEKGDVFNDLKACAANESSIKREDLQTLSDSFEMIEDTQKLPEARAATEVLSDSFETIEDTHQQPNLGLKSDLKKGASRIKKHVSMSRGDEVKLLYLNRSEVINRKEGVKSPYAFIREDMPMTQSPYVNKRQNPPKVTSMIQRGPTLCGQSIQEQFGPTNIPLREYTPQAFQKKLDVDHLYELAVEKLNKEKKLATWQDLFNEIMIFNQREEFFTEAEFLSVLQDHSTKWIPVPEHYFTYPQIYLNEIAEIFSIRFAKYAGAPLEIKRVRNDQKELLYKFKYQIVTEDDIRQKLKHLKLTPATAARSANSNIINEGA